jgi:hypothetical protein
MLKQGSFAFNTISSILANILHTIIFMATSIVARSVLKFRVKRLVENRSVAFKINFLDEFLINLPRYLIESQYAHPGSGYKELAGHCALNEVSRETIL